MGTPLKACTRCGLQRRSFTDFCRACRKANPLPRAAYLWTEPVLERLWQIKDLPGREIAAILTKELRRTVTYHAVESEFAKLKWERNELGYSAYELHNILGCSYEMTQRWMRTRTIKSHRWPAHNNCGPTLRAMEPDVIAFLINSTWAYDWKRIRRHHPWREIARQAHERHPWFSILDVAAQLAVSRSTVQLYTREAQIIPQYRYCRNPVFDRAQIEVLRHVRDVKQSRWAQRIAEGVRRFNSRRRAAAA